jgi:hypothetical protein
VADIIAELSLHKNQQVFVLIRNLLTLHIKMKRSSTQETKNKSSLDNSESPRYTSITGPNDVFLGQGSSIIRSPGNLYFRHLLQDRRDQYISTCRRKTKNEIAQQIIVKIGERNGRFLRQVLNFGESDNLQETSRDTKTWIIVDNESVAVTIKQTLRDPNFRQHGVFNGIDQVFQETSQEISSVASRVAKDRSQDRPKAPIKTSFSQSHSDLHFDRQFVTTHPRNVVDQQWSRYLQQGVDISQSRIGFDFFQQRICTKSDIDSRQVCPRIFSISNTANDVHRNLGMARNHSSKSISKETRQRGPLPLTSQSISHGLAELNALDSLMRPYHCTGMERRSHSAEFHPTQLTESVRTNNGINSTLDGRKLLIPNLRNTLSLENTRLNNFKINRTENYLGTLARRNDRIIILPQNPNFPSQFLCRSHTFQAHHLDRLQDSRQTQRWPNEIPMHNRNITVQDDPVAHLLSATTDPRIHNILSGEHNINQPQSAQLHHETDEFPQSSPRRTSTKQKRESTTTPNTKRKFQSNDSS